jgi:glucokinase
MTTTTTTTPDPTPPRTSPKPRVLAGDIGGTNTRLALFDGGADEPLFERVYPSAAYTGLDLIAEKFLAEARAESTGGGSGSGAPFAFVPPEQACFGIAGPVEGNVCRATNLPWVVDGRVLMQRLGIPKVRLVNDFFAAALGSIRVPASALAVLGGGGPRDPRGPVAVLGAGTGLGQAFLLWSPASQRYEVVPSEGGHADFAPRTPLESSLLRYLAAKYGRVSYERVLSGQGLVDLYAFLNEEPALRLGGKAETRLAMAREDPAAVVSRHALDGSDPVCQAALAIFCGVLGALAGNLALTVLATGGVFVAGGIAPRILPFLSHSAAQGGGLSHSAAQGGGLSHSAAQGGLQQPTEQGGTRTATGGGIFREAFERKGRLQSLVASIPSFVVTHPQPGLLGAASVAMSL